MLFPFLSRPAMLILDCIGFAACASSPSPPERIAISENGRSSHSSGVAYRDTVIRSVTLTPMVSLENDPRLGSAKAAIGIVEFSEAGEGRFVPLRRKRIHRNRAKSGPYAWYQDYVLPPPYGVGVITVRLHGNEEDAARRFNRTENVRPIPPSDPDFPGLYSRRNDSESLNRALDDSLFLGRAHSLGHARQHVEILGWPLLVNSLTLDRPRRRTLPQAA